MTNLKLIGIVFLFSLINCTDMKSKENHVLAKNINPNSAVHRDSCVEFFVDPDQSGNYYNFEFNCIGTTHLAYGPSRSSRTFIPSKLISNNIKTWSTLGNDPLMKNQVISNGRW